MTAAHKNLHILHLKQVLRMHSFLLLSFNAAAGAATQIQLLYQVDLKNTWLEAWL